jgi:uncharacterized protein HemX
MRFSKFAFLFFSVLLLGNAFVSFGQNTGNDGSPQQRLEVMRQKLETIRKSASSAASVLEKEEKTSKEDKKNADTPVGRLRSIEKDAARLLSDVNEIRGRSIGRKSTIPLTSNSLKRRSRSFRRGRMPFRRKRRGSCSHNFERG